MKDKEETRGVGDGLTGVTWGRQQGGQGRTLWQGRIFSYHPRSHATDQPNFRRPYEKKEGDVRLDDVTAPSESRSREPPKAKFFSTVLKSDVSANRDYRIETPSRCHKEEGYEKSRSISDLSSSRVEIREG